MRRSRTPADNAVAESSFATLETGLLGWNLWPTRTSPRTAIAEYTRAVCNRLRRHSHLDYNGPEPLKAPATRTTETLGADPNDRRGGSWESCPSQVAATCLINTERRLAVLGAGRLQRRLVGPHGALSLLEVGKQALEFSGGPASAVVSSFKWFHAFDKHLEYADLLDAFP